MILIFTAPLKDIISRFGLVAFFVNIVKTTRGGYEQDSS